MVPGPDFIESYLLAWDSFEDGVSIGSFRCPPECQLSRWQRYLAGRGRLGMADGARLPGKYFTSGNFSIRKTTLDSLGGFDTSFAGWGGEDTDFGLNLDEKKIALYYARRASCIHYHKKSLNEVIDEYTRFGRNGYPVLIKNHPADIIFDKGWLLGLPDSNVGPARAAASLLLWPLRSAPVLSLLRRLAGVGDGALFNDIMFDWLFYGHLAKGYRSK
jgi:GT2 family glycosyltransferase